jgi:hypothetical protein
MPNSQQIPSLVVRSEGSRVSPVIAIGRRGNDNDCGQRIQLPKTGVPIPDDMRQFDPISLQSLRICTGFTLLRLQSGKKLHLEALEWGKRSIADLSKY